MATAQRTHIHVTHDDLRRLSLIIIRLDDNPPEPEQTWLRLYKGAIEDAFIPRREVQR